MHQSESLFDTKADEELPTSVFFPAGVTIHPGRISTIRCAGLTSQSISRVHRSFLSGRSGSRVYTSPNTALARFVTAFEMARAGLTPRLPPERSSPRRRRANFSFIWFLYESISAEKVFLLFIVVQGHRRKRVLFFGLVSLQKRLFFVNGCRISGNTKVCFSEGNRSVLLHKERLVLSLLVRGYPCIQMSSFWFQTRAYLNGKVSFFGVHIRACLHKNVSRSGFRERASSAREGLPSARTVSFSVLHRELCICMKDTLDKKDSLLIFQRQNFCTRLPCLLSIRKMEEQPRAKKSGPICPCVANQPLEREAGG